MSQPAKCQASDLLTHSCVPCRDSSRHLEFSHFGEKMYAVFALHERRGGGAGGFACQMPQHVRISQTIARFSPARHVCLSHWATCPLSLAVALKRAFGDDFRPVRLFHPRFPLSGWMGGMVPVQRRPRRRGSKTSGTEVERRRCLFLIRVHRCPSVAIKKLVNISKKQKTEWPRDGHR